jgi:hypothetical protein
LSAWLEQHQLVTGEQVQPLHPVPVRADADEQDGLQLDLLDQTVALQRRGGLSGVDQFDTSGVQGLRAATPAGSSCS